MADDPGSGSTSGSPVESAPPTPASPAPPSPGPLSATLVSRSAIAPGVVELVMAMRVPANLSFQAGQFVSVAVNADEPVQVSGRRSYSIASPRHESTRLRFIVRVIPDGAASDYLMSLPLGAEVRMTGPHGFFVLDARHPGDIVFGATGTGVSAVMPMLSQLANVPVTGRRLLYWGARHEHDLFARGEIEELCRAAHCELRLFLTKPSTSWAGGRGRITGGILAELPLLTAPTFYLVGNGAMISELKRELVAQGVNRKKQIRTEAFFD